MAKTEDRQERYTIQAIDKALDLIELLAERGSLSLIELTDLLNQPKSSTYRMVLTLENRGYITRSDEDGKYCLGYKQLTITKNVLERSNIRSAALQEMKRLSELYGDTVNLGVLLDGEILYVEIIESSNALRMSDRVGSKSPIHATAMGKVIAAHLPESALEELLAQRELVPMTPYTITSMDRLKEELDRIRLEGYAVDDQEIVIGARCVAAPVFGMFGKVYGAISISGPMHRYTADSIPQMAAEVKRAAQTVSLKLGYVPSR